MPDAAEVEELNKKMASMEKMASEVKLSPKTQARVDETSRYFRSDSPAAPSRSPEKVPAPKFSRRSGSTISPVGGQGGGAKKFGTGGGGFSRSADAPAAAASKPAASSAPRAPAFDPSKPVSAVGLPSDDDFWDLFKDLSTIGRGHFSKVKAIQHRTSDEAFAAKILDKASEEHDVEDLVREFSLMCKLNHPNIIKLYGAYETPRRLYLVMELATGGQLMARLAETDQKFYSEALVQRHTRTILEAIAYMHSQNCSHRDLKPENVLLSSSKEDATIKIVDLGLSRVYESGKAMQTVCGTHMYLAPELVHCDRGNIVGYDKSVDLWGVGLLAFIMLHGFNPFSRSSQLATHEAIVACEWSFPDGYNVSKAGRDFLESTIRANPAERPTADAALKHPWFGAEVTGALRTDASESVQSMLHKTVAEDAKKKKATWLSRRSLTSK